MQKKKNIFVKIRKINIIILNGKKNIIYIKKKCYLLLINNFQN